MIKNWFSRKSPSDEPFKSLPAPSCDRLLYIVGDVHGRADLLETLLAKIEADYEARSGAASRRPCELIFVGDYIDRGDDSRGVLEALLSLEDGLEAQVGLTLLMGNHEAFLLEFLEDPSVGARWCAFGGLQTLASYGVTPPGPRADADAWRRCADALEAALGAHLDLIDGLALFRACGNIFVCHAAVDPGAPLDAQREETLLWGDDAFLRRGGPRGVVVVHGHTIFDTVDVGRNRVGVDTGAFSSGRLSALVADPETGYAALST